MTDAEARRRYLGRVQLSEGIYIGVYHDEYYPRAEMSIYLNSETANQFHWGFTPEQRREAYEAVAPLLEQAQQLLYEKYEQFNNQSDIEIPSSQLCTEEVQHGN